MMLEEYEVYDPTALVAGSSVGGLLLLALITAILYKVSVFIPLLTPLISNQALPQTGELWEELGQQSQAGLCTNFGSVLLFNFRQVAQPL